MASFKPGHKNKTCCAWHKSSEFMLHAFLTGSDNAVILLQYVLAGIDRKSARRCPWTNFVFLNVNKMLNEWQDTNCTFPYPQKLNCEITCMLVMCEIVSTIFEMRNLFCSGCKEAYNLLSVIVKLFKSCFKIT